MTIWILTFLVVGGAVGLGWRQGVIRTVLSFFGIIFAALLAGPIGHLLKPLLHHTGFPNETEAWMVAPVIAFLIILTIFKVVGHQLHRKSEAYHKHYVSELEFNIWKRLNTRLGICMGFVNGTAYMVLLTFILFNLGFWTTQVATADSEPATTRLVNHLATDAQKSGLANVAPSVGVLPADYYRLADLGGLICQNPGLTSRLARYPMFTSLLQRDDILGIVGDSTFTNAWASHVAMGEIIKEPVIQNLLGNNDLINIIWTVVQTNMNDLTNFLVTAKSSKYDGEPVIGQWDFNPQVTFAYRRLGEPSNLASAEIAAARAWMANSFGKTFIIVTADDQAYLKFWPDTKATRQPDQPIPTLAYKGQWMKDGSNYDFTLGADSDSKTWNATTDGQRLFVTEGKNTYVFDRD